MFLHFFLHFALQLVGIAQQSFHGIELFDELFGRFITYARQSGNIVAGIAHHSEVINHLFGAFHAKSFLHFGNAPNFDAIAHSSRTVHKNVLAHQLPKILVGSHHKHLVVFFFGLFGQGADEVVGLIPLQLHYGNLHGLQNLLDVGYGYTDGIRSFIPVCFVVFEHFGPLHTTSLVKGHSQMVGLFPFNHIKKGVHEPHNGRGVHPFGVDSWVFNEGIVAPENQRVGV